MTLVEVLAGLTLLGTVLAGILIARGRLAIQDRMAQRRLEACRVLEGLMERWWADPTKLPRTAQGLVPDQPAWHWRTETVASPQADALGAAVVRVELRRVEQDGNALATQVEILLPAEPQEQRRDAQGWTDAG